MNYLPNSGEYAAWRNRLQVYQGSGKVLRADPDKPEPGTYRVRSAGRWLSVQLWNKLDLDTGEMRMLVSLNGVVGSAWQNVWPKCAETPVTPAAYKHYQEHGRWPDDVADYENANDRSNFVGAEHSEKISASLSTLEAEAIFWFESIGSTISSQDHADRAANYAQAFLELEKSARAALKEEIEPLNLEIGEARTKWTPLEEKASAIKKTIKQEWLLPWLSAAKAESAATPKAGSSSGKRIGLGVRQFVAFTDLGEFLKWAVANEPTHKLYGVTRAAQIIARRALKNDKDPPGIEVKEEDVVR